MGYVLLFIVVIAVVVWMVKKGGRSASSTSTNPMSVLGMVGATAEGNGVYTYSSSKGSIAINNGTQKVAVQVGKDSKTYAFTDIRAWKSSADTPVSAPVGGSKMNMVRGHLRALKEAAENKGLVLEVKDIDHAVWQIPMEDKELHRWMEILRQAIEKS